MKRSIISQILVGAFALSTLLMNTACDRSRSSDLMDVPPTYTAREDKGDILGISVNPRVDILFVIDNSLTMADEQDLLKTASEEFVEKLGANSVIDYRIGVISVYDDTHSAHCNEQCLPAGKLRAPFISRSENAKEEIKNILNIGTHDYRKGGPQFEEIFSPIAAALSPAMNQQNGGFIRPDSRVVVIMVTDESDSTTDMSIDEFVQQLKLYVDLNRLDLYAIATQNAADRNGGQKDRAPLRIQNAIEAIDGAAIAKQKMFNIRDTNYAKHLVEIVTDIRTRVLTQDIQLQNVPARGTLQLFYGDDEVKKGWFYNGNPSHPIVSITEDIDVTYHPDKYFKVKYTQIEQHSIKNGKVTDVKH